MNQDLIEFIGKEKYIELLKKHNLCTKKWTYGRTKEFYKEINQIIRQKLKEQKSSKKKNRSLREKLKEEK